MDKENHTEELSEEDDEYDPGSMDAAFEMLASILNSILNFFNGKK